ncbi:M23 family metallopeptidase [Candidatus Woesearchaeota archaeon]|nr:M23 family metallopeptidase [Candidatus Woesearchaeota archaeon]
MTYILPFSTVPEITQGFFGGYRKRAPGTHKKSRAFHDSTYAIDFGLEEGTQLRAARAGFLADWRDSGRFNYTHFLDEDADPLLRRKATKETNYVTIRHNDGTFAIYAHLYFQGVDYELKERWKKTGKMTRVEQGQPIGWSGNTGLSTGPHLHLVVCKRTPAESVPIRFKDYRTPLDDRILFPELHEGK